MDVWKSMVSGKAIQEHMEDVYHDMIKVGSAWMGSFHLYHCITPPYMFQFSSEKGAVPEVLITSET